MLKRLFDFTASSVGLLFLLPVFAVIALLIKLTSPGPVFHRAQRIGLAGKSFTLYKFRSMIVDAHRLGPAITAKGDSRVTPVGRFLRGTKLDELPQLINVVKGDMSLVGPRPEDPRYVAIYTPEQRAILAVRPGITSAASVAFRHEERLLSGENWESVYRNHVMPQKIAIDLQYLQNRTLLTDIGLIFHTFIVIVYGGYTR
jgi:lipopolysaccharide/colanic/teichoic acid biosynthesis glycosyltransferase